MSADASHARLAGFLYLGTIGFGVYAEVVARGALIVRGHPAATAQAIFASGSTFRFGMIADLAMLGCYIGVTILLHGIFRKRAPRVSAIAASFSLIGIAMLACDTLLSAMILRLPDLGQPSSSLADWVYLLLRAHGDGYKIGLVFFGAYCLLLGSLLRRGHAISSTASPGSERRSGRRSFRNISPYPPCSANWRSHCGCWRSAFASARRNMRTKSEAVLPEQGR